GPGERNAFWTRRYVLFHGKRHPRELDRADVGRFLDHVAHTERDTLACLEAAHTPHLPLPRRPRPRPRRTPLSRTASPARPPPPASPRPRGARRVRHFSPRTEDCYAMWAERFIRCHGLRHPNTMGGPEIERFLTDLAVSTQNQASGALLAPDHRVMLAVAVWA